MIYGLCLWAFILFYKSMGIYSFYYDYGPIFNYLTGFNNDRLFIGLYLIIVYGPIFNYCIRALIILRYVCGPLHYFDKTMGLIILLISRAYIFLFNGRIFQYLRALIIVGYFYGPLVLLITLWAFILLLRLWAYILLFNGPIFQCLTGFSNDRLFYGPISNCGVCSWAFTFS